MRKNSIFRVSLVSLDWVRQKDPKISLGHASILAKLIESTKKLNNKQVIVQNHEFDVKDSFSNFDDFCNKVAFKAIENKPDLIAFGAFIWNEAHVQKILLSLRNFLNYRNKIIIGGPQVTYAPIGTLEKYYPLADIFIRGYAENAFSQLVSQLSTEAFNETKNLIKGVHISGLPDIGLQAKADLESLPSPFLTSLIDLKRKFIRWESQRGCPFRCTFCQHRDIFSKRDSFCLHRIENEIQAFCNEGNSLVNDIAVHDPTFNSGNSYLNVLDSFIKYGYKGKLSLQTRLEMINDKFLDRIEKLNSNGANVQLECGIQTIINEEMKVIKRFNNLKKIESIAKILNQRQINYDVSIIYGLPQQKLDSFKKTVDYCTNVLKPSRLVAWPLMILRGTELDTMKKELQLNEEIIPSDDNEISLPEERILTGIPHVTSSKTFTKEDWLTMKQIAQDL